MLPRFEISQQPTMQDGPVIHPADWRGQQIKDHDDPVYRLDMADLAGLKAVPLYEAQKRSQSNREARLAQSTFIRAEFPDAKV